MRYRTIAKIEIDVDSPPERALSIEYYPITGETDKYFICQKVVNNELKWIKLPKSYMNQIQRSGKNKTLRRVYGVFEEVSFHEIKRSEKVSILVWGLLQNMTDALWRWKQTIDQIYGNSQ